MSLKLDKALEAKISLLEKHLSSNTMADYNLLLDSQKITNEEAKFLYDSKDLPSHLKMPTYFLLSDEVKKEVFFELIFMTYSYVHRMINNDMFPNAINLYDKEKMTGRGHGKYGYKEKNRIEAERYLREQMKKYFPTNKIEYIV